MRTKTILLTAALVAAGVASSMAQSSNVYSLNVVGYVNITLVPGYNLVTLPLQNADPTSAINSVLTNQNPLLPLGSLLYTWDNVHGRYAPAYLAGGDGNWYDGNFNPATNTLPPGDAFFVQNGLNSNVTVTVVGTVLQGTNSYAVNPGYGFYGDFVPIVGDLTTNGFPIVDNSLLYTWDSAHQRYFPAYIGVGTDDSAYDTSGNLLGTPGTYPVLTYDLATRSVFTPAIGQGFIYQNPGAAATWTQAFTVQ
jgi:hypothetical protein